MAVQSYFRLLNGRPEPDQTFDAANIPTSDEKAALAGSTGSPASGNEFVTTTDTRIPTQTENDSLVGPVGFTPSASDRFAVKSYVDQEVASVSAGVSWLDAVDHGVQYIKTTTGAPTNIAEWTVGERCCVVPDNQIYITNDGTNWTLEATLSNGDSFMHWELGDNILAGARGLDRTPDDLYRVFNGASFDDTSPTDGDARCLLNQNKKVIYNGTGWVVLESLEQHNEMAGVQGGTAGQFFHITSAEKDALDGASLSASNPVLSVGDLDRYGEVHVFSYVGGYPANTTTVISEETGALTNVVALGDGSITKAVISIDGAAPSAGTLAVKLQKNGADVTSAVLDLLVDSATTDNHERASTPINTTNLTVAAGDTIGVELTSSATWDQTTADITVQVHLVYNSQIIVGGV